MRDVAELQFGPYGSGRPYPPPSLESIGEYEDHFHVRLPPSYVAFLRVANGGAAKVNAVRLGNDYVRVNDFYGLGSRERGEHRAPIDGWDYGNLWAETRVRGNLLGERTVPIGESGGADIFFLDCRHTPAPVRLLDGSTREIRDVAPSFDAFVDALTERPRYRRPDKG
jgi:hypothetical protein